MNTIKDKIKKKKAICIILGIITILTIFLMTYPAKKIDATSKTDEKIITENIKENKEQDAEKNENKQQSILEDDNNKQSDAKSQNDATNQTKTDKSKSQEKTAETADNLQSNKDTSKSSGIESENESKSTAQVKDTNNKMPVHNHKWVAVYKTVHHNEAGHYEIKTVQKAYDEDIYDYTNICNGCGKTELEFEAHDGATAFDWFAQHTIIDCGTGYHNAKIKIGTKHHDAVTKKVWVVDKKAYDEKVITGYKCSCGATK